jgi:TrmH family RNA methyltransferase
MKAIKNISKEYLKAIRKLTLKKYRESEGRFIIEGVHLIEETIASDWKIESIVVTPQFLEKSAGSRILNRISDKRIPLYKISEDELNTITDTVTAQGITAIVRGKNIEIDKLDLSIQNFSSIVFLDRISDAGNLGTIIRTCDWFGIDAVIIGNDSIELFNPKVIRSTMGSLFNIPIFPIADSLSIIGKLKKLSFTVFATSLNGDRIETVNFPKKSVFIFGSEAHGISDTLENIADRKITIPKYGSAESLNVAVACGIIIALYKESDFVSR